MVKFYAVCNANGPISVAIEAESVGAAMRKMKELDSRSCIDDCRTDAEDQIGFDGQGMDEDKFASAMAEAGYEIAGTHLDWSLYAEVESPGDEFSITWEFIGRASQQHFDVAQAVADAMMALGSAVVTSEVVNMACDSLGDGWDPPSVYASIQNCSFTNNEEAESA